MKRQIGTLIDKGLWILFKRICKLNKKRPGEVLEILIKNYLTTGLNNSRKELQKEQLRLAHEIDDLDNLEKELK